MQDEHCLVGYKSRGRTQQDENVHSSESSLTIQIYYFSINNARMEVTPLSPLNHPAGNLPTWSPRSWCSGRWPHCAKCNPFFSLCVSVGVFFKKEACLP